MADDAVGGGLIGTWSFKVVDGQLAGIRGVINPDKLRRQLGPLADLDRLRERLRTDRPRRGAR